MSVMGCSQVSGNGIILLVSNPFNICCYLSCCIFLLFIVLTNAQKPRACPQSIAHPCPAFLLSLYSFSCSLLSLCIWLMFMLNHVCVSLAALLKAWRMRQKDKRRTEAQLTPAVWRSPPSRDRPFVPTSLYHKDIVSLFLRWAVPV